MQRLNLLLVILFPLFSWGQSWKELNSKAMEYSRAGNYNLAIDYAKKAIAQAQKEFGKQDSNYATCLSNAALLYLEMGNYAASEELNKEALTIRKKLLGTEHMDYLTSLSNLGLTYKRMGNYTDAMPMYEEVLASIKKMFGEAHSNYAATLNNLASLNEAMGNYTTAEPLYKQALASIKKIWGEKHPNYATGLSNLGLLYQSMGNFAAAEPILQQAVKISKEVSGEGHPNYGRCLNNLALLYEKMSNYLHAATLYKQTLAVFENSLGQEHPYYGGVLNNIAALHESVGNYEEAEMYYKQALAILQRTPGTKHPEYAAGLNNLGELYITQGNYTSAEPLLKLSLEIKKRALGEIHPDYALSLNNLALLYKSMGQYITADSMYNQSAVILKKTLGENHLSYATPLSNLAALKVKVGNYAAAESLFQQVLAIISTQIKQHQSFLSERELTNYLSDLRVHFESFYSFALSRYNSNPAISGSCWNLSLFEKGLLLKSTGAMRNSILNSKDSTVTATFNNWIAIKRRLAKEYSLPIKNRVANIAEIEMEANELEKELVRSSHVFKEQKKKQEIATSDVQSALHSNEVAIEFIRFDYHNGNDWTDSIMYAALVLRPGMKQPALIPLFEQKQLDSLFDKSHKHVAEYSINSLYKAERGMTVTNLNKGAASEYFFGEALYKLVWNPIEAELKGVKTVYYSPSGELHKIAFAAIPLDSTQLLSDKYKMVQLSNTAELVGRGKDSVTLKTNLTAVLFGGINYDITIAEMQAASNKQTSPTVENISNTGMGLSYASRGDTSRGNSWGFLGGTLKEVEGIYTILNADKVSTSTYTGSAAVEDALKNHQGKNAATVLHIATHGFFFPELESAKKKEAVMRTGEDLARNSESPLLRSGLLMAGGNNKWKNDTLSFGNIDDGILTAYEVSNMDLSGTRLAVLSACQTGLGDIKGSEGVYGLQRAFKMAGVKYLTVSLWTVPDEATQQFMTTFYTNWSKGGDVLTAFNETQQTMRKIYKDPYWWAGFVLVE